MPRVVIMGNLEIAAAFVEEFKLVWLEVERLSRLEPGCNEYIVTQKQDDSTKFHIFEVYKSQEAFEEHMRKYTTVPEYMRAAALISRRGEVNLKSNMVQHYPIEDTMEPKEAGGQKSNL